MKRLVYFALATLALLACNKTNEAEDPADRIPVGFDTYVNKTKADINDVTALQGNGFGVFAYYTDNADYDQFAKPNFMYNQSVTYSSSAWSYSPVKYWPNEYGSTAGSDDEDKISFFAYAPYVESASETTGIVGLSKNTAAGDPLVKYAVSLDPAQTVDLLWGVSGVASWDIANGGSQTLTSGLPWLDIQRPSAADAALTFTFKHALAKLNVQIKTSEALAASTKIFVRSISFTGFALKGTLNLNNTTADIPLWLDAAGVTDIADAEFTIYDGLKDGKEGYASNAQSNEKTTGLNSQIIQNASGAEATTGVTNTAQNLFNNATATNPIMVIPTGEPITITIAYDIETTDSSLATYISDGATHGISIENVITKTTTLNLAAGKAHTLTLTLGMNDINFDAAVGPWGTIDPVNTNMPE